MTKLSTIQNLIADVRKLTIGDMFEGEFASAHEAYDDYHWRIEGLRSKLEPIIDDTIEEFADYDLPMTVDNWLDMHDDDDEEIIWNIWRFLNPND